MPIGVMKLGQAVAIWTAAAGPETGSSRFNGTMIIGRCFLCHIRFAMVDGQRKQPRQRAPVLGSNVTALPAFWQNRCRTWSTRHGATRHGRPTLTLRLQEADAGTRPRMVSSGGVYGTDRHWVLDPTADGVRMEMIVAMLSRTLGSSPFVCP